MSHYLTMEQTTKKLGMTRQGVYYLIKTGQLKKYKLRGRTYFLKDDIVKLSTITPVEAENGDNSKQ